MFDIGFTELLVIGVVALIVVGPKDLPTLFRTLGRFTARMRALGREFTSAMNSAADESGMKDVAKDLKGMTSPRAYGLDKLNEAADKFDNWTPGTPSKKPKKPAADDPERAADVEKIRAATEAKGREKLERDRAAAAADAPKPAKTPAAKTGAAKTGAAKTGAAKTGAAKKPAAKKPAAKKPTAAKTAATKAATAKTTTAKTAKKPAAKKPAAKPAAKKPAATKAAARKPAAPQDPAETKTDRT